MQYRRRPLGEDRGVRQTMKSTLKCVSKKERVSETYTLNSTVFLQVVFLFLFSPVQLLRITSLLRFGGSDIKITIETTATARLPTWLPACSSLLTSSSSSYNTVSIFLFSQLLVILQLFPRPLKKNKFLYAICYVSVHVLATYLPGTTIVRYLPGSTD